MADVNITYEDALKINDILYNSYIARLVSTENVGILAQQLTDAFSANQIEITEERQNLLDILSNPAEWSANLPKCMTVYYKLRYLFPIDRSQEFFVDIDTPAKLGIVEYTENWQDGTYTYLPIAPDDVDSPITVHVDRVIVYAVEDNNLPVNDLAFIQTTIENAGGSQ